jgi:hypothetical protein
MIDELARHEARFLPLFVERAGKLVAGFPGSARDQG